MQKSDCPESQIELEDGRVSARPKTTRLRRVFSLPNTLLFHGPARGGDPTIRENQSGLSP